MKFISLLILFVATFKAGAQTEKPLIINHLTGNIYVFTTYNTWKGMKIPANGLYILTGKGAILIDTPWDTTQFQPLLDSIEIKHNEEVVLCISTHSHEDRTGGLEFFRSKGIKTYTTIMTDEISRKSGQKRAEFLFKNDTTFSVGNSKVKTFYFGEGHAPDNIVIWVEDEKILYGGCFIKSSEANDLGNLNDANPAEWIKSIRKTRTKFANAIHIIPGHGDWADKKGLDHTLHLLEEYLKK